MFINECIQKHHLFKVNLIGGVSFHYVVWIKRSAPTIRGCFSELRLHPDHVRHKPFPEAR